MEADVNSGGGVGKKLDAQKTGSKLPNVTGPFFLRSVLKKSLKLREVWAVGLKTVTIQRGLDPPAGS